MMTARTPYDTSIGSVFNTSSIETALEKYLINVNYNTPSYEFINSDKFVSVFITGVGLEIELPIFKHPVVFVSRKNVTYVFTDVRTSVDTSMLTDSLLDAAKNKVILNYEIYRNIYTIMVLENSISSVKSLYRYSSRIFTLWLSGILSRTLVLDTGEKNILNMVLSAHYYNLNSSKVLKDTDMDLLVHTLSGLLNNKPKDIRTIVEKLDYSNTSIDTLAENIKMSLNSPKTKHLTSGSILNFIGTSWFGPNSNESIPMAIEHVPTWLAILFVTSTEKTFKKSVIADVIFNFSKKKDLNDYILENQNLIRDKM